MKRIFNLSIMILVAISCIRCSSDDDPLTGSLKIIESDVTFNAEMAKGSIIIESIHAIEAKSNKDWCTVSTSGNVVHVDVTTNIAYEGRNALITVSNGYESINIPVTQQGAVLMIDNYEAINFSVYNGGETIIKYKSNLPVTIETEDEWINYKVIDDNSISITVESTTKPRKGMITLVNDNKSVDVEVKQLGTFQDLVGSWQLFYYDMKGKLSVANVTLVGNKDGESFTLVGIPPYNAKAMVSFEEKSSTLTINAGQYLGYNGQHYLYLTIQDPVKGNFTSNSAFYYTGLTDLNTGIDAWVYSFVDSGSWSGYQINALGVSAYNAKLPDGKYVGDYARLQYCMLIRQ
ncbi:BACON domain-containing protein [Bacteroides sp. 224]|uniref:BACON domain-containing protein n=1 Tax=Bacteroides sp. 224 TaxID=2302936 RepID=UPI0013D3FF70|nr:BACON domain-containing carbohydrate-binding protein [Bacteroides sp. 224]NDV65745.1 hypothetical protein [Bacteroides sp. 224]